MDFASTIDLKNPDNINWDNYIFRESAFYTSRGSLEPKEEKKTLSFPLPDASIIVILHEDHKIYYSNHAYRKSDLDGSVIPAYAGIQPTKKDFLNILDSVISTG